jgi:hypothetical protein
LDERLTSDAVDFELLESTVVSLGERYARARPYPHIVLDGFLRPELAAAAYAEFEETAGSWTRYLHLNERKFAHADPTTWSPSLQAVASTLQSERFTRWVSQLTGIDGLVADPAMDGGGLHRSGRGGFLNLHADFTAHHINHRWHRRVNLILYLNERWAESWGGALEMWPADLSRCEERVVPVGNRAVIFTTDEDSFHGHPDPMECPDGVFRQSLALYYFTEEAEPPARSTNYRSRPGDGVRGLAIAADREALRFYDAFKRRLRFSDGAISAWFGWVDRRRHRQR